MAHSDSVGIAAGGAGDGSGVVPAAMNWPREVGQLPTATVAVTPLLAVSMTETVSLPAFATYTRLPSGLTATPMGPAPTNTVAVTLLLAMSMTETALSLEFAM